MSELDKLIEAVEAGSYDAGEKRHKRFNAFCDDWEALSGIHEHPSYTAAWNAYNGSLDAALALHEALLPGWVVERLSIWPDQCHARLSPTEEDKGELWRNLSDPMVDGDAPTPARAWLLAILRAYRSVQA